MIFLAIIIFVVSYFYLLKCWSEIKEHTLSVIIRDIPIIIFGFITVISSIYIIFS